EAAAVHPQQLFLLELCHGALAGALASRDAGVYVGISGSLGGALGADTAPGAYAGTGCSLAVAAGRVSFVFGLVGPSLPVDTACSASLVALHVGAAALGARECARCVVAGEGLLEAAVFEAFAAAGMLSPLGRCHAFDARADGYCRGEGGVAARLAFGPGTVDARAAAVRQDGASASLTAPNGTSQRRLLRVVLDRAAVAPASLEAHGTGTALGDP
ncbi:hypothetical protein AURANDRAFT_27389, partial [Aureococcus anophagefferens]